MVKELEDFELESLADFLSKNTDQNFSKQKYLNEFDYWWKDNPSYESGDIKGWIIVDENDKVNPIKGFMGNIPINYILDKKSLKTYNASNWYVDEKYKKEAIYLAYAYFMQEHEILLNSTPSQYTEAIFLKLGCKDIAKEQSTFMSIEASAVFEHYAKKIYKNTFFNKIIAETLFSYYKLFKYFITPKNKCKLLETKDISTLMSDKDKLYMQHIDWLVKDENKKIFMIEKKGDILGYIIVQYVNNSVNGLRYLQILDYQNLSLELLSSLIKDLKMKFDNKNIDAVIISNFYDNRKIVKSFINITSKSRSICLVKSEKDYSDVKITSIVGEKGILFWE